jgi:FkbH-like protein
MRCRPEAAQYHAKPQRLLLPTPGMTTSSEQQPPVWQAWQLADLPLHKLVAAGRKVSRESCRHQVRLAVLGDSATQHYCQALTAAMKLRGVWPELYEAEFDTIRQEVLDPDSRFHAHHPQFVILFNTVQALESRFVAAADKSRLADDTIEDMRAVWDAIRARHAATIVQHNFAIPVTRPYGNQTIAYSETFAGAVHRINHRLLIDVAAGQIRLIDTESQAAYHGKKNWFDERLWCQARQALSPALLPPLVKSVSDTVLADLGIGLVKCIVVDLDNTMWGGILGDDGIERIEIGHTEVGLAFLRFQQALVEIRERGVLLAVCSKNHESAVLDALDNHPDMLLRSSDFVAIVANYDDKVSGLMAIRERLNIGFDSFVFLDDSPFERDIVRNAVPEIQVPDLAEDPADVVKSLAPWNLFEGRAATTEDHARLALYQADAGRKILKARFAGLGDYLRDLSMIGEVLPIDAFTLPRVSQLIQRSNQFNLTTIRYSEPDLAAIDHDQNAEAFCLRLTDRLGDNGVIAALILRHAGADMVIDSWVMSCRVLGRTVEEFTLEEVVGRARRAGCTRVIGRYIPTAKNGLVAGLYRRLGFTQESQAGDTQLSVLEVDTFKPIQHYIVAAPSDGEVSGQRPFSPL